MSYRRKARECALQMLYELDLGGGDVAVIRREYWRENPVHPAIREFADLLVVHAARDRERIDAILSAAAENWRLDRMGCVDRNLLRLAVAELLHTPETPRKVVLNEAIEIAKKYGAAESPQFVNGVLDGVLRELAAVADAG